MQMSLAMSMRFIFGDVTRHAHHVFGLWQWCNFSQIDFRVFMHAYSIIVEYDIKSKYPEEYSTVDKVESQKLLAKKSCFVQN